ncbi:hypothetical protein B4N89_26735 [Embleya scabrispora]|uniref:Glycosyltransferase subfamily 4-like N-terminal domain-containing protein n=1 Tax=Embleya scabrispora TaxID=159449 RepID=A0A1T3P8I9_9ACTN|nr:hypothetical protein B4N89_26735 [Embleya scabrispora]
MRVASVPAGHVYVRHCAVREIPDTVVRLPDPRPNGAPSTSQRWWPPVMLDPDWVDAHHDEFDLYHLHFGFDAESPARLRTLVDVLAGRTKPFVYTVHDLHNPHQRDPAPHEAALDVLIPAADHLITLTPGAAAEIARRWKRSATVLPHPHVVAPSDLVRPRPPRTGYTVGLHAKSLRPNMAVLPTVRALMPIVAELPSAVLRVDIHPDVEDPAASAYAPNVMAELREYARSGAIDLRVHDYFDDAGLWDYLSGLDLSVLPYLFGTHSGWLEACHDLGTAVAVPDCGFHAQQRPCFGYRLDHAIDPRGPDAESLGAAVREAYRRRHHVVRADPGLRAAERARVARAHREIYRRLLS